MALNKKYFLMFSILIISIAIFFVYIYPKSTQKSTINFKEAKAIYAKSDMIKSSCEENLSESLILILHVKKEGCEVQEEKYFNKIINAGTSVEDLAPRLSNCIHNLESIKSAAHSQLKSPVHLNEPLPNNVNEFFVFHSVCEWGEKCKTNTTSDNCENLTTFLAALDPKSGKIYV